MATFDAFISYSLAGDAEVAPPLRAGLERMAKKWTSRRALRVFLDKSGLSATPTLWDTITAALDDCQYLVVLACPEAVASHWVSKEIEYFVERHGADRVLMVLTEGTCDWDDTVGGFAATATAIPDALRQAFAKEPLWIDLRWARGVPALDLSHLRFREAVASIAAPIHGVPLDELDATDLREHRRQRRVRAVAMVALAVLAAGASVAGLIAIDNAQRADRKAQEARESEDRALASETEARASEAEAVNARRIADARRLAAESQLVAADQTDLAALLALESLEMEPGQPGGTASLALAMTTSISVSSSDLGDMVSSIAAHGDRVFAGYYTSGDVGVFDSRGQLGTTLSLGLAGSIQLAVSGDGSTMVVRSPSTVVVVDIEGDDMIERLRWPMPATTCGWFDLIEVDETGDQIALAAPSGVQIWGSDGVLRHDLPMSASGDCRQDGIWDVALSADGTRVAAAWGIGSLSVWATDTGRELDSFDSGGAVIRSLAFASDARFLFIGDEGGVVARRNIDEQGTLEELPRGEGCTTDACLSGSFVYDLAVSPDGTSLIAASRLGLREWSVTPEGQTAGDAVPLAGRGETRVVRWASDDVALGLLTRGEIRRWQHHRPTTFPSRHSALAFTVAASEDGRFAATGGFDGKVVLHDVAAGTATVLAPEGFVVGLAFDPSSRYLVASVWLNPAPSGSSLVVWDVQRLSAPPTVLPVADVLGMAFDRDGTLFVGVADGNLQGIVDAVAGRASGLGQVLALDGWATGNPSSRTVWPPVGEFARPVLDLDVSDDGQFLALGTAGDALIESPGQVVIVDTASGISLRMDSHVLVLDVEISHDGRTVAAAGEKGAIALFDRSTGEELQSLVGHVGFVRGLAFSMDDQVLISTGQADSTIRFWDVETGQPLGSPVPTRDPAFDLAVSTGTLWIASGDGGLAVVERDLRLDPGTHGELVTMPGPDMWRSGACVLAGRSLTPDERRRYLPDGGPSLVDCLGD